jgi:hypothetical protein
VVAACVIIEGDGKQIIEPGTRWLQFKEGFSLKNAAASTLVFRSIV